MPATVASFVAALVPVIGVALLVGCLYVVVAHYYLRRRLQRYGVPTTGVVVRLVPDTGDFEAAYYPVVRFHPAGHAPVEARYQLGNTPPAYVVGQVVSLYYDPSQPTRFVLGHESGQGWAWLLALGLVGAILAYCLTQNTSFW
jgi:drug/metabolite transporter (DMT)-like permease